jgi:hypothetical protein
MKQSATSAVRMGSYNCLRELSKSCGVKQNTAATFATVDNVDAQRLNY